MANIWHSICYPVTACISHVSGEVNVYHWMMSVHVQSRPLESIVCSRIEVKEPSVEMNG